MNSLKIFGGTAIALAAAIAPTRAQMPISKPFSMRGVELGISIDQFRELPALGSEGDTSLRTHCVGDPGTRSSMFDGPAEADREVGVIACQWFGRLSGMMDSSVFVDLGAGKVLPVFEFVEAGDSKRLFRISSFANSQYYPAVRDALTRGYGAPKVVTAPFQTRGGGNFTQTISRWNNGLSDIILTEPCRQLQRYCVTYRHTALSKNYDALLEKRAAAAVEKL